MENLECPHCGNALANGVAVCGACGREVKDEEITRPAAQDQEKAPGGKKLYAILAVLLVVLGGAALLIFTGLLPNPMKGGGSTAAIVNGEKITIAEVDQKLALYQKMFGKNGQPDVNTPEGKAAAADMRTSVLNKLIQEKIFVTEAAKENVTVSREEIKSKIDGIKKNLKLSDKDFDAFLQSHGMTVDGFEKRMERDLLVEKMMAKGTAEKGLSRNAWSAELQKRAKVEILSR